MAYELIEDSQPDESFTQATTRNVVRQGSNLLTRARGTPGDIFSLVNQFIAKPATEVITGKPGIPYEETSVGHLLPTTESLRKQEEKFSGEYLKPQNKVEQFADDIVEDAAMLFFPGSKVTRSGKAASALQRGSRAFLKSAAANTGGEIVKGISDNPTAGAATKLGTLFALSLFDKESAAKLVGKLYGQAENALPEAATVNAKRLASHLDAMEHKITSGRPKGNLAPSENFVMEEISKLKSLIKDGRANIKQLWAQKRSLNEELSGNKLFEAGKEGRKRAKELAKPLNGYIKDAIEDYGRTNKEFYKPFREADEAFGTLAKSNWISNWINNSVKYSPVTHGLLHILGGTGAAVSAPIYYGTKLGYRIAKSPTLRKIYGNTVKGAIKEDAAVFNKELEKLDHAIQEEEAKDRYEFID